MTHLTPPHRFPPFRLYPSLSFQGNRPWLQRRWCEVRDDLLTCAECLSLQALNWNRVDVLIKDRVSPFLAHNHIQVDLERPSRSPRFSSGLRLSACMITSTSTRGSRTSSSGIALCALGATPLAATGAISRLLGTRLLMQGLSPPRQQSP